MRIPKVLNDLLPSETVKQFVEMVSQPNLVSGIKDAAQQLGWKETWGSNQLQTAMLQTKRWLEKVNQSFTASEKEKWQVGINATGAVFSNRWASSLVDRDVAAIHSAMTTAYTESHGIESQLEQTIKGSLNVEAAIVTHSLEQSISLLKYLLPPNKDWAIARADCLRLSRGSDLTMLLSNRFSALPNDSQNESAGTHRQGVFEVGAANSCSKDDWNKAAREGAAGFVVVGQKADAIEVAKEFGIPVVELLIDGIWKDYEVSGLSVRSVSSAVASGADIVCFAGDGWMGGPACGVLAGKQSLVDPARRLAKELGLVAHSPSLASLQAAVVLANSTEEWKRTPVGLFATTNVENLENRAQRISVQLNAMPGIESVTRGTEPVRANEAFPNSAFPSSVLRIKFRELNAEQAKTKLQHRDLPVWVTTEGDVVVVVLRTVDPSEDLPLVEALEQIAS